MAHRIGIIGLGKIAQDQHIPVIRANPAFELIAVSSQRGLRVDGVPHAFKDHREMLALADLDAVAICAAAGAPHDRPRGYGGQARPAREAAHRDAEELEDLRRRGSEPERSSSPPGIRSTTGPSTRRGGPLRASA